MLKKCLTALLTGIMLVTFSLPVFAATNNEQKVTTADLQKAFPGTDISTIVKSEKILLTPENKAKLVAITGDKVYVDKLYH